MTTLTEAQRTTLANHIKTNADQAVINALAARNDTELANLYNQASEFIVWRESIQPSEYREALVWTEIDGLQVGKARVWEWITQGMTVPIDATKQNIRQGIADVFPQNQSTRAALLAIAMEPASVFESVYTTGTGTEQTPGVRTIIGEVTQQQIGVALNENP